MSSTHNEHGINATGMYFRGQYQRNEDDTWFWVVTLLLAVMIVLGNGTVIYLVTTQRRLRRTGNWFVLSLAIADFFIGIFIIPTFYACSTAFTCLWNVQVLFYEFLLFVSIGNLCAMTMDRYIAIMHPLRYPVIMTTYRARKAIAFAWIIPGTTALIPLFWRFRNTPSDSSERVYRAFLIFAFVLIPITVLLLVYARILAVIRRHCRQCDVVQIQLNFNLSSSISNNRSNSIKSSARVMGGMIFLFVVCWGLSTYRSLCFFFDLCTPSTFIDKLSRLLLFLNSAGNPMVYSLLKEDMRKSLVKCLFNVTNRCVGRKGDPQRVNSKRSGIERPSKIE